MTPRNLVAAALTITALAPAGAYATDTTIAADPVAQDVTALDGTVVWVSGKSGHEVLMAHTASGDARVKAAPEAKAYRTVDLGRNSKGKLVLTYLRCRTFAHCTAFHNDLRGHRKAFKGLAPKGCALSTAPALWGKRWAYGLGCHKASRSGLYVNGTRLPLPKDAVKFGVDEITSVDLRGRRVAAVSSDIFEYAFTETVGGKQRHAFLAAASEGDSDEHARGLALASGGVMWALTDAEHAGDPNESVIFRAAGACVQTERLITPAGPDEESTYLATDLAVDGATLYLVVPGMGIVSHAFAAERPCGR
jgi:hypothetical protein